MRIERIRVDAFGRLRSFDSGPESLGPLVVVLGPNEAGKSTLFRFLTTALYGFHPASRERNPHVPWGSEEASGRIQVTLSDGSCTHVERRLRSSPTGRLTRAGVPHELRNQPVPWATHVPRGVFGQVFAITLADLAGLDGETWARIQDRIVGSMGSTDLASAREVADRLEREASEIWRPNRRGNQRLRTLRDEARALRARRAAALERDRRIRHLVEERAAAAERLMALRGEREEHKIAVERGQSLLPIKRQLARVRSLRAQGGPRDELEGLPSDPEGELAELDGRRARLEERISTLERELEDPRATLARFDDRARTVLRRADDVTTFLVTANEAAPERRRARDLEAELTETRAGLQAAAERLLETGWTDGAAPVLEAVSVDLVRDRVTRAHDRRARAETAQKSLSEPFGDATPRRGLFAAAALATAVGAALLWWGITEGSVASIATGAVVATAGLAMGTAVGLARAWRRALARARTEAQHRDSPADAARELEAEIEKMLGPLPVRSEYLSPPASPLVDGLVRLQELVRDERDQARALQAARARVAEADASARVLARSLGRGGEPTADALAAVLDRELREAERLREAAHAAEREMRRLERELEGARAELARVTASIDELRAAVARLGEGEWRRGSASARARLEAHERAGRIFEELERAHPDLAELMSRIEELERGEAPWHVDEHELARRRAAIEELDERVEALIARAEALERDAAHLAELETVDAVDSEIATLRETEHHLVRERDRKWVLGQLVRQADRRFREEHQPDLVRRAGEHLARLTGGRYDRMLVDETDPEALFHIVGPELPAPVPLAPPISTGTLEQAYLSLRFAIVDHLDRDRERLPLFLDEAFVNWDGRRRDRGLDVLAELGADRQLFVFTCHPPMAEGLEARGARVLNLERVT